MASYELVITGPSIAFLLVMGQAITWTNDDLLSMNINLIEF